MKEPKWLLVSVLMAEHEFIIAEHGGIRGIRDMNALKSSCVSPMHLYHYSDPKPSIEDFAARYAYSISRSHPFCDGNKRMALQACEIFLVVNGYELTATQEEKYLLFLDLAQNHTSENDLVKWIKEKSNVVADN